MATVAEAVPFLDQRRRALVQSSTLVGLDRVRARRAPEPPDSEGYEQWDLWIYFVPTQAAEKAAVPRALKATNLRITLDGVGNPQARIHSIFLPDSPRDRVLRARVVYRPPSLPQDGHLESPVYALELHGLSDVDRFFAKVPFVFQEVETDEEIVPSFYADAKKPAVLEVDYLAKDYDSFRRLLLERMAFFVPRWQERNPSDLGVTIAEVLAYGADYLSYYQDAAATEAYIETCRRRVSVRRHARLVDYRLHEGCNARCWVEIKVVPTSSGQNQDARGVELERSVELLTYNRHSPGYLEVGSKEYERAIDGGVLVFQTMHPVVLYPAHNRMDVYAWGVRQFSLSQGSTEAALVGHFPDLHQGQVLVFEERSHVATSSDTEVDPRKRQAVRLCQEPVLTVDPLHGQDITEIKWFDEDALDSPMPVTAVVEGVHLEGLTVARGNLVLADHGATVREELSQVPEEGVYNPSLTFKGLTFRVPFDLARSEKMPARGTLDQLPWEALPDMSLAERRHHRRAPMRAYPWRPRHDLLASGPFARDFVVEVDNKGLARLRFGDGEMARRPLTGSTFVATYRTGAGPRGNVGAYAIRHVALRTEQLARLESEGFRVVEAKNHLAAAGGTDPEPMEHARIFAPDIVTAPDFLCRCVTQEDYSRMAERNPEVRRAVTRHSWTGSWATAFLYVQRRGGKSVDSYFQARLREEMDPYLMAGWDLEIRPPHYVPLDVHMTVWLDEEIRAESFHQKFFFWQAEKNASRSVPGETAWDLFDPDRFTFAQPVYASEFIARAMQIRGVVDAKIHVFRRWGEPSRGELEAGMIPMGPLEIARLDSDRSAPQHGTFRLKIEVSQ